MNEPVVVRAPRDVGAAHVRVARVLSPIVLACCLAGCLPRVAPLAGTPAPARFPPTELPDVSQQVSFQWEFADPELRTRGEGVARLAPPDSVRLDLFVAGGFGSGMAWLLGDSVVAPGGFFVRRLLPPPALMWATLGRLAVPPAADTVVRITGDTVRADIGSGDVWRVTFVRDRLVRLERIEGGRLREWVARQPNAMVHYGHETARRSLDLTIIRSDTVPGFDATIWPR